MPRARVHTPSPCLLCGDPCSEKRKYCSQECRIRARLGDNSARRWRVAAMIREGETIQKALTDLERKTTLPATTTTAMEDE